MQRFFALEACAGWRPSTPPSSSIDMCRIFIMLGPWPTCWPAPLGFTWRGVGTPLRPEACSPFLLRPCTLASRPLLAATPTRCCIWSRTCSQPGQAQSIERHANLAVLSSCATRGSREPSWPRTARSKTSTLDLSKGERLVAVARSIQEEFMRQRWAASGAVRGTHPAVRSARSYIDDRWQDNFTLGELASAAGMSPFHLLRTFSDQVGMTPSAYRRALRVENARRRLRAGASCAQAALESGFCDQSHLNRHFKHVVGVTPGQYAAAVCD